MGYLSKQAAQKKILRTLATLLLVIYFPGSYFTYVNAISKSVFKSFAALLVSANIHSYFSAEKIINEEVLK